MEKKRNKFCRNSKKSLISGPISDEGYWMDDAQLVLDASATGKASNEGTASWQKYSSIIVSKQQFLIVLIYCLTGGIYCSPAIGLRCTEDLVNLKYKTMKKDLKARKLLLNKKTVSVLKSNEMVAVKGGAVDTLSGITNPRSDSFIQCGSCHGACATNTTISKAEY